MNEKPLESTLEQQYLTLVSDFATDMLPMTEIDEVLWHVAQNVVAKLGFEDIVIYIFDEKRQLLIQKAAFGHKTPFKDEILNPLEVSLGQGIVGEVGLSKEAIIIDDTRLYPAYIVDDKARLSELTVPLIVDQQLLGVIDSEHSEVGFYTQQNLHVLTAIASMMATQISKIKAVKQLEETIVQLEYSRTIQNSLFEIAELIFETSSMNAFYQRLHRCISRLTFANNFYVALLSEDKKSFTLQYCVDEMDDVEEFELTQIDPNAPPSATAYVLLNNEPLLTYEADFKKRITNKTLSLIGTIPKAWLGVPFGDDNFRGAVVVQSYLGGYMFTPKDKRLLTFVAKHVKNAIERMQHKSDLEFYALHDPLTKLPNRLLFTDRLTHAIEHVRRKKNTALSVFFLDLDNFKQVNDHYGHHIGDFLLQHVAKLIDGSMRKSDTLCRLGGDEFAILLENITKKEEAIIIAENICQLLRQPMMIEGVKHTLSTSIGVTYFCAGDETTAKLLVQADEAMYQAKKKGRDQVCFYQAK